MKRVGAAFKGHIDRRPALDPILCRRKLLNGVLGDGVVAENGSRDAQYAGLPNNFAAVETVVIRHAIDHVVVGSGALPANAHVQEAASWGALHARGQGEDGFKVATLGRKI